MSTEFISMLPPPGNSLSHYDPNSTHDVQHDTHIPNIFLDAMSIREAVFVQEQKVPLSNEFDTDDPRSFHWVTYVSVGHSGGTSAPDKYGKRGSTASRLAVGTVRLVPPPHAPHQHSGDSEHKTDNAVGNGKAGFNPHHEPFIKIARLAVLPTYRGLGLARLLMDSALMWAAGHPAEIVPPISAADREARKMEGDADELGQKWKGLVLAHAQSSIEGLYKKWGWERDESMGEWDEEGIMHVAMFKRLRVKQ